MKPQFVLFLTLSLLCLGTGAALAQTPDELPPSLETVCDMETGAAFGHCNAYCEAMDCELANDSDPNTNPSASANACSKVRTKFQQATGRDVPCEVTCPCNTPAFPMFSGAVSGQVHLDQCLHEPFLGFIDGAVSGPFSNPAIFAGQFPSGQWVCGQFGPTIVLPITPAQGQYCLQLVEQASLAQNVVCR